MANFGNGKPGAVATSTVATSTIGERVAALVATDADKQRVTIAGQTISVADLLKQMAAQEAEIERLKKALPAARGLSLKVGEKGGVSLYGLNSKWPVSLYAGQWERLLEWLNAPANNHISTFIAANEQHLDRKS
jgi:hypothetical protein